MSTENPSRRQQVIETLQARVQGILVSEGFATDAGQTVFLNDAPQLGPDDPHHAIAMLIGDDEPEFQQGKIIVSLPVTFHALAKAEIARPWLAVEQILADLKRAIEIDLTDESMLLGGLLVDWLKRGATVTLKREEGATTIGVSLTYIATYAECWGAP